MARMKRSLSDSMDSDDDDVFDDSFKDGSPSQSCQVAVTDRKKRRGIIEKRRRDRINSSLSELRRLVPTAFEKQGSAKLEKAEILQMTVDHLQLLHQKGINGYNYPDPHALAMDYRSVGFRECAAEVARYLVTVEGMDIQDPLRLRLMSHLQCFSAQREAASKATIQNSSWGSVQSHPAINSQYGGGVSMTAVTSMLTSQHPNQSEQLSMNHSNNHLTMATTSYSEARISQSDNTSSLHGHMRLPNAGSVAPQLPLITTSSTQGSQISPSLIPTIPQLHTQFPVSFSVNSLSMMSPSGAHTYNQHQHPVKPYRPWGAELAY